MKFKSDPPNTIPVFPLQGALLLPRARLPLNVFEPMYLQMLEDSLKTDDRLIGMIQMADTPPNKEPRLHQIGCAGRVTSFSETEDGRYLITLTGLCRFRLVAEIEGFSPYRRAEVDWRSFQRDLGRPETDDAFDRPAFLDILHRYFEKESLSTDWDSLKEADEELLISSLSMLCPFGAEEKQALLEAPDLKSRREILHTLMEFALRAGRDEDVLQ